MLIPIYHFILKKKKAPEFKETEFLQFDKLPKNFENIVNILKCMIMAAGESKP